MSLISPQTVPDILANIPPERIELVRLMPRAADGATASAYGAYVLWQARRKPTDFQTIMMLGGPFDQKSITYQLFKVDGQTVDPAQYDRIIGGDGVGADVSNIGENQFQEIFDCHTLKLVQPVPGVPTAFVLTTAAGGFSATWVAPTALAGLDHYELEWSWDNIAWASFSNPAGTATSASESGLLGNYTISVRLRAVDVLGQYGPAATGVVTTT